MKDELYHQAILELARTTRQAARLEAPDATVTIDNPPCGDRVTLEIAMGDGRVREVGHRVRGCLLCQAATAVIAARAPGETPAALREIGAELAHAIGHAPAAAGRRWSELAAFAPVHPHKSRHDCVLLPFQALGEALDRIAAPTP